MFGYSKHNICEFFENNHHFIKGVTMEDFEFKNIIKISDRPELISRAAAWFSDKWSVPQSAYEKSMREAVSARGGVPQWYVILDNDGNIIAGAGLIQNDFHDRPDLAPNLCALYVEENFRLRGIAGFILNFIRADAAGLGIGRLYLVTDHTGFYEKYGWSYLTNVNDNHGVPERMYTAGTFLTLL